ncbi:hypothetical protein [Leifsonia sp. P73]|uniref:hypothetical protein n=1 Tax=Leifsonia sp. P73 TaxID=3423959 RepID=UPI003DA3FCA2
MEEFTEEDPGLGDPAALDELIWQLRRDQTALEKAHAAIQTSAATIREHWKGKAGDAAAATHDVLMARIKATHAELDRAVSACGAYQLAHDEVKESAAPWVTQLAEARRTLGLPTTTIAGPRGELGVEEFISSAMRNRAAAIEEEAEALSHLAALHEARIDAQSRFRKSIAEITEKKRGPGITAGIFGDPTPKGTRRRMQGPNEKDMRAIRDRIDRANATVWTMVDAWISGKGKRTFTFDENHPFTQVFTQSASVARAEADIQGKILEGESNLERKGRYDARGEDLPRDLNTIVNAGFEGNLPEAFIGSFDYTYEVTKLNDDGTAVVTIKATNVTTPESATRIPSTETWPFGPYHVPPYDKMKHLQETKGQFQPITQEITWTQTLRTR